MNILTFWKFKLQKAQIWSVNVAVLQAPAVGLQKVPQFSIWLNKEH